MILVNSNPATIMTDPELADRTYIEPLNISILEKIIIKERPDALLSTMGGQTALNLSIELENKKILKKYGVKVNWSYTESNSKSRGQRAFQKVNDENWSRYARKDLLLKV